MRAASQQANKPRYRAFLLKEELRLVYHLDDPELAPEHLDAWLTWASRSRLEPFVKLAHDPPLPGRNPQRDPARPLHQGDAVNRKTMLRLANACGLTAASLRDVLFDLPHSSGSDRRRAEPNPLSNREAVVLALLAQGKVYKVIAAELELSASTVRSHLHNTYAKLSVTDRAQAVLKATEMGWI